MTRLKLFLSLLLCICTHTIKANSKDIFFLDPVIVDQSFDDFSESQHSPNLIFDSSGYLLTYQIDGVDGCNVKTIRLHTDPQFNTVSEYFLFDSTQSPLVPTVCQIGNKKPFFWFSRHINTQSNDTLFEQQLMLYDGDRPTKEEFENTHSLYSLEKANSFSPQFMNAENRIYCEILKKELSDPGNNRFEFFLRSLDSTSSDIYPLNLHFSANGKTALVEYGDSLLIVKSWVFCTEYENLNCTKWATGYKAYIIFENKIQSIHALSSNEVSDKNLQPDDIFVRSVNNENLFALRQSNQLMKINLETMSFEELLDLSLYTNQKYKKIIPIQTIDYCIVILIDEDNNSTIMRFDPQYQFVDSVSIPFEGNVTEISDFVYDKSQDILSYAYTTNLFDDNAPSRIFLQSVLFDKDLVLTPAPELPDRFTLSQNYPNPFNPTTTIKYTIPQDGHTTIDIYNLLGQKVSSLFNKNQTAGEHFLNWDASNQSSGIYLVKVSYDDQTKTIKTMLLK